MLSEIYPKIKVVSRDPNRRFDILEREVIWNRDKGTCQNPSCVRPDRRVAFRDATIHHIVEHCTGGKTNLRNGVLICPECHTNRVALQSLTDNFQTYITRIYDRPQELVVEPNIEDAVSESDEGHPGNGGDRITITIDWGALDIDRPVQKIRKSDDTKTIVELLNVLLETFKDPIKEQLMELPIVRFPLSTQPMTDFLNRAQGRPYAYTEIGKKGLYFCPQSQRTEKVARLKTLFSRLTLPDGGEFPEGCIEVVVENG